MRTFVLFANQTQGMALHLLLQEVGIKHQITAVPRTDDLNMPCGMSLLIPNEEKQRVEELARAKGAAYLKIVQIDTYNL